MYEKETLMLIGLEDLWNFISYAFYVYDPSAMDFIYILRWLPFGQIFFTQLYEIIGTLQNFYLICI